MIVDVKKLENLIRKATLDYTIETMQLTFDKEKVRTKIFNTAEDTIVFLDIENDIMPITGDGVTVFNFIDPSKSIMPYLKLIDDEHADIQVKKEKIVLKSGRKKSNIFFCSPIIVKTFNRDDVKKGLEYFTSFKIGDDFVSDFNNLKKVGTRFGKIYLTITDNVLYMESTDKTNRFSNGFSFAIGEIEKNDLSMCFNYRNIINLIGVLNISGIDTFSINLAYLDERRLGIMYVTNEDNSERYYLMSKEDL